MESIKRFLGSGKSNSKSKTKSKSKRYQISSPIEGTFERLTDRTAGALVVSSSSTLSSLSSSSSCASATTDFTPQARGRDETLAFLRSGTFDSLKSLLSERDRAGRQVVRGPNTRGTRETQFVLRRPSRRAVEHLQHVCRQAEMAVRYGVPGAAVYNFSRSMAWNRSEAIRMPSLQLRDLGARMNLAGGGSSSSSDRAPSPLRVQPPVPFVPITWLDLGDGAAAKAGSSTREGRRRGRLPSSSSSSATAREDVKKEEEEEEEDTDTESDDESDDDVDDDNDNDLDPYDDSPVESKENQWEMREARALEMTEVPAQQIRKVQIKPGGRGRGRGRRGRRQRPVQPMTPIAEVKTPAPEV
ncbi:hypothetical protein F4778DRAFT_793055 [Xylariomycetidae sp. FL2044]|nr:hypothetical protein F4778DRAFT_793055 [Xylariomycetidae sp. FL2044]